MIHKRFRQPLFTKEGDFHSFHYWGFISKDDLFEFRAPASKGIPMKEVQDKSQAYIGRKDVHGKDVYSGDVIQSMKPIFKGEKGNTAVIEWDEKKCMFILSKKLFGEFAIEFQLRYNNLYQVIGNVYQNPELL